MTPNTIINKARPWCMGMLAVTVAMAMGCESKPSTPAPQQGSPAAATEPPASEPAKQPERQLLTEGSAAPDFTAPAHDGSTVQLSKLAGQPVVLYFYPKDDTPGCTVEAQSFRDGIEGFNKINAKVIGVSLDDVESHKQFAAKHNLNFPLVADSGGEIAAKFGVPVEGGMAARVTFVISADGKIARVFPKVSAQGHAEAVLAALAELGIKPAEPAAAAEQPAEDKPAEPATKPAEEPAVKKVDKPKRPPVKKPEPAEPESGW